ncbi:RraA family protein [Carnobacterium sp.]|uniref:RraA family protein n=1 Tax=Carnobacterium sp. TaxID=48221 RepID=UPI003C710E2C
MNTLKKQLIREYKELDSCTLSDAFDELNLKQGGCILPKQMIKNTTICGQVFTVKYVSKNEKERKFGTFLEDIPADRIVVIDNQGRIDGSVWGDTMALYAQKNGVGGAVLNGVYRDVGPIQDLGFPVFAKGCSSKSGKELVRVEATNVAIEMDNVLIEPDDLIFGDESGVIVIPFEHVEIVLNKAKELKRIDTRFVENLANGLSYKEAKTKANDRSLKDE